MLDFPDLLDKARAICRDRRDIVHIPDVTGLLNILVPVNLCLLVSPLRKGCRMRPHSDSCRSVNQFEMAGKAFELLLALCVLNLNLEKCIIESLPICFS